MLLMQDCAKNIVSSTAGVGYCLGAVALIGSQRRQNAADVQGWLSMQQSVAALTQGPGQVGTLCAAIYHLSCLRGVLMQSRCSTNKKEP